MSWFIIEVYRKFDIIIFDLGLSSNQLDNPKRGFSFNNDGPLDMNMGGSKIRASDVVNKFSEKKLADIFFNFGEEKFAKRIAKNILDMSDKPSPFIKIPAQQARLDTLKIVAEKNEDHEKMEQLDSLDRYLEKMKLDFASSN